VGLARVGTFVRSRRRGFQPNPDVLFSGRTVTKMSLWSRAICKRTSLALRLYLQTALTLLRRQLFPTVMVIDRVGKIAYRSNV